MKILRTILHNYYILRRYLFNSFSQEKNEHIHWENDPKNHINLIQRETKELSKIATLPCDTRSVARMNSIHLESIFSSKEYAEEWNTLEKEIARFSIPDNTGGVNVGDRRAIYYLIKHFEPASVLEIGTHIGASTIHIALALKGLHVTEKKTVKLVTIDIQDVNDPISKPWIKFDSMHAPIEMVNMTGCEKIVTFMIDSGINYLSKCRQKYDLIFLDGDHSAPIAYQEISGAMNLLNEGGIILLHDYFPDLKPLWSDNSLIPGVFLATERLKEEGADIQIIPLGKLPWQTRLNSYITNLALLGKNDHPDM